MSSFSEAQVMQIVRRIHILTEQVDRIATHATMLANASSSLDAYSLLEEANSLAKELIASRKDFETAGSYTGTLSRTLPSRPPASGGMSPAAKWGTNCVQARSNLALRSKRQKKRCRDYSRPLISRSIVPPAR